jgi:UDPglucose 6-dehydrogenase
MRAAVVGAGKVGRSTIDRLTCFVDVHDPALGYVISDYDEYDIIFICVDTLQHGPSDYTDLSNAVDSLVGVGYNGIVVIRSTISPEYVDRLLEDYELRFVFFPEFLPQSGGELVADDSWMIVLGGGDRETEAVKKFLYINGYYSNEATVKLVSSHEAALIKLAANAILATKVVMFNSINLICKKFEMDYKDVIDALKLDKRLGADSHSTVPSPDDGKYGFGGHCLPKDLKAMIELDSHGFFKSVEETNKSLGR